MTLSQPFEPQSSDLVASHTAYIANIDGNNTHDNNVKTILTYVGAVLLILFVFLFALCLRLTRYFRVVIAIWQGLTSAVMNLREGPTSIRICVDSERNRISTRLYNTTITVDHLNIEVIDAMQDNPDVMHPICVQSEAEEFYSMEDLSFTNNSATVGQREPLQSNTVE